MNNSLAPMDPLDWISGHDTGISSTAIWAVMMGRSPRRDTFGGYPHDPDDFGRCYRLLKRIPAWRPRIGEMASVNKTWAKLAEHWDELEAMYEAVEPVQGRWVMPAAEKMYHRMKELGA